MNNYIFDLDGTIINSSKEVLLCFKKAFEKANYAIDENRLNSDVIGPPLKEIIILIAPDLKDEKIIDEVMKNFRDCYDFDENDISILYAGAYNYLNKLKSEGKRLFLATFKPTLPTMRLVKQFKLDMFEDIYTIDKFGENITKDEMITDIIKKYGLKKSETVMIGDAPSDVKAAKKSGVIGVGVLWGYGTDKTSLIQNSDLTVKNIEELECLKSSCPTI